MFRSLSLQSFLENCNTEFEGDVKEFGDTVKILNAGKPTIHTHNDGKIHSHASEDLEGSAFFLPIKQVAQAHFGIGDIDKQIARGNLYSVYLEETKTGYELFLDCDFDKFNPDELVKKAVKTALDKFGGTQCKAGKYPTVLHSDIMSALLSYFLNACSSDEVQRKSSFLIDKIGQKVASSKLTIEERPLEKNIYFSYFDAEGVATQNKFVVKKGVLQTYFYNLETAKKAGVESTGNAAWAGSKIGISFENIFVKPGKQSFEELIAPIKEGVYITEIAGLGTGMNARSGDFSCQADGFMIRDGKIAEPLNLITLSGNLLKMLQDLKGFSNRVDLKPSGTTVADAYIKKMSIGGK